MKIFAAILSLASAACFASGAAHADTVVRIFYPAEGHVLTLRGTAPLSWDQDLALTQVANGVYEATFISAPAEVKPLLDGQWSLGANFRLRNGAVNNLQPRFFHANGRVQQLALDLVGANANLRIVSQDAQRGAKEVAAGRRIFVYLPPSYDETPDRHYPVIYAQDGQNIFEALRGMGSPVTWGIDRALDQNFADDPRVPEVIVVGIESIATRTFDYTPTVDAGENGQGGGADQYLTWMFGTLKPAVDSHLRTLAGGADTAILGSSLGGLLSAYAAAKYPEKIAAAGMFSPSTWWDNDAVLANVTALGNAPVRPVRLYVDYGADHDGGADTALLAQALTTAGYAPGDTQLTVIDPAGLHNEESWARRFPAAARFMLQAFAP